MGEAAKPFIFIGFNYTSVDPKQMWKFSIILYMRTKEPRVEDKCGYKCGRQVKTHAAQRTQSGRQV